MMKEQLQKSSSEEEEEQELVLQKQKQEANELQEHPRTIPLKQWIEKSQYHWLFHLIFLSLVPLWFLLSWEVAYIFGYSQRVGVCLIVMYPVWSFGVLPIVDIGMSHLRVHTVEKHEFLDSNDAKNTNTNNGNSNKKQGATRTREEEKVFDNRYTNVLRFYALAHTAAVIYTIYHVKYLRDHLVVVPWYKSTVFWGQICSLGLAQAAPASSVSHELYHRLRKWDQFLGKLLLTSMMYTHFAIEHVYGHHKHVATEHDPATARFHQSVYAFFVQSAIGGYMNSWCIENEQLKIRLDHLRRRQQRHKIVNRSSDDEAAEAEAEAENHSSLAVAALHNLLALLTGRLPRAITATVNRVLPSSIDIPLGFFLWHHRILHYSIICYVLLPFVTYMWCGWSGVVAFTVQAFIGIWFVEVVNYFEHYGLQREPMPMQQTMKNGSGVGGDVNTPTTTTTTGTVYEPVQEWHSWDMPTGHLSKLSYCNLVLHSDHHHHPLKHYEYLEPSKNEKTPTLPYSYAIMVLMSLVPPLFFHVMHQQPVFQQEKYRMMLSSSSPQRSTLSSMSSA